jgi:hypothetical protein
MNDSNKDFETLSRLKFIGHIKKGERIDVSNVSVLRPSILTSLYRTFIHRDNRTNALHFIRETVTSAFEIVEFSESGSQDLRNIVADIRAALLGIQNIRCTYSTDLKFCCDIEIVEQFINTKLSLFSK